jgi:hypothetical protein
LSWTDPNLCKDPVRIHFSNILLGKMHFWVIGTIGRAGSWIKLNGHQYRDAGSLKSGGHTSSTGE